MEFLQTSDIVVLSTTMLLLLLNSHKALNMYAVNNEEDDIEGDFELFGGEAKYTLSDLHNVTKVPLHHIKIISPFSTFEEDFRFWIKLRSTTWFSRFVVN